MARPRHHLPPAATIVFCALVLTAGGGGTGARRAAPAAAGAILVERSGAWEYTYHVVTGSEALFDLGSDPRRLRNLVRAEPELADSLRESLETRLGVSDLSALLAPDDPRRRALRAMGYL
jgi:hypothetical protein